MVVPIGTLLLLLLLLLLLPLLLLLLLLLLLTPNKILKKTENRVLLSVSEWGPSTAGRTRKKKN